MSGAPNVLVVAYPPDERAHLGSCLEEQGYEVTTCPGPRHGVPCVGMRGRCALAEQADAVVLDLTLEEDPLLGGVPGWQVLDVYLELGLGVVALADPSDARLVRWSGRVIPVARSADPTVLGEAVEEALRLGARMHGTEGDAR